MADAIARAKDEIFALGRKIEVARNEELRFGQQRTRLEAERSRIQAFVDMCEMAQRFDVAPIHAGQPAVTVTSPDNRLSGSTPKAKPRYSPTKPKGAPTVARMIVAALEDAASRGQSQLQPREITEFVRRKWWPNVGGSSISTAVWRMAQNGRLQSNGGGLYRLNRTNAAADHQDTPATNFAGHREFK
jgi:hypothetical protein